MTGALLATGIVSALSFIGTRAAADQAEARAELAVANAISDRRRARNEAQRAMVEARSASLERTRARAEAASARQVAAGAQQAAAAAQKSAADAAQRMLVANAQVASAQARSDKLTSDSRHLAVLIADSLHRPRIHTAMAEQEASAQAAFAETQQGIEELRAFNPAIAASLAVELGKARGDRETYQLDLAGMTAAAGGMDEAANGPVLAGVEEGAAMRGQADVLRGRALWLEGQDREALASFERAIASLSGIGAERARLALADAYFERASALLARGEERDVAAAAEDAEGCRKAVGLAPASSGAADAAADAAAADDSANRLAAARCLIVAGAAAKSDDGAAESVAGCRPSPQGQQGRAHGTRARPLRPRPSLFTALPGDEYRQSYRRNRRGDRKRAGALLRLRTAAAAESG